MAEAAEEPGYAIDEGTEPGFVRLKVKVPNLKAKKRGLIDKFKGNHPHPRAKNADIDEPAFHSRGFELKVHGHRSAEMKGAEYHLHVQQTPHEINVEDCYLKAEDGWIYVFLKKMDENQSWEKYIREGNIDLAHKA